MRTCRGVLFSSLLTAAVLVGAAQEGCCPDRANTTSLEAWMTVPGGLYVGLGYSGSTGSSISFGIGRGTPFSVSAKYRGTLIKACHFDLNVLATLSLGADRETILCFCVTFNVGISAEFCFPASPSFAIEVAGGLSFQDCACYGWLWKGFLGPFVLLGLKYYL